MVEHRSDGEQQENHGLNAAAMDLMHAVEHKDVKGVAMALQNAFTILDSEPHEEGEPLP